MPKEYIETINTKSNKGWARDLIFLDTFEDNILHWRNWSYNTGTATLDNTIAYKGNKSLKLDTGATSGSYARVEATIPKPEEDLIKFLLWINNHQSISSSNFTISLRAMTKTSSVLYGIDVKLEFTTTGNANVYISENGQVSFIQIATGLLWSPSYKLWNPIEIGIDLKNAKYIDLRIAQKIWNLSQYKLFQVPSSGMYSGQIVLDFGTTANKYINVDEILVDYL
jgi:hypothetical protein